MCFALNQCRRCCQGWLVAIMYSFKRSCDNFGGVGNFAVSNLSYKWWQWVYVHAGMHVCIVGRNPLVWLIGFLKPFFTHAYWFIACLSPIFALHDFSLFLLFFFFLIFFFLSILFLLFLFHT